MKQSARPGFTLIELLVSITILSFMLLMLASMISMIANTWLANVAFVDNFSNARTILTLLDRDTQSMVLRPDLAAFVDNNGNSALAFYTRVPGAQISLPPDTRTVSLVHYLLTNPTTQPVFERVDYGVNFTATTPGSTLSIGNTSHLANLANANSTTQTETLSSGVLMLQFQFVDGTGVILTPPYTPTGLSSTFNTPTPFYFNYAYPGASYNPRVLIISMLAISDSAYSLAKQGNTMTTLLKLFPSAGLRANEIYSQYWNGILNSGSFGAGLPAPVRSGVQVFERFIPLPITTPST
jgi:prepilin-type N-terminal cleavage/methylation domain-containing protein